MVYTSEVFTNAVLYQFNDAGILTSDVYTNNYPTTDGKVSANWFSVYSRFDYAPFFYVLSWTDASLHNQKLLGVLGDNNQGRPINKEDLKRLHQVAILSELNVPFMK